MARRLSVGAVAIFALIAFRGVGAAAESYTFAIVPRNTDSPYFDGALAGCKKAEKETKQAIRCLYIGPGKNGGSDEQAFD